MSTASTKRKRVSDGTTSSTASDSKSAKTTQSSISSFLSATSKKKAVMVNWQTRGSGGSTPGTLLIGTYVPSGDQNVVSKNCRTKVAAFDLDSTLIQTKSGKVHSSNAQDWKWWHPSVPKKLKELYSGDDFIIAVISNQAGLSMKPESGPKSRLTSFKTKVNEIFSQLDIPITIYAATEKDLYRKPRAGIWLELLKDYNLVGSTEILNIEESIFVGDAAGRQPWGNRPKDFSCSDRGFAENVGVKFATPEEFFLGESPRPFVRNFEPSTYIQDSETQVYSKRNEHDVVLLCGSPGAGKSTWYRRNLEPLGYVRVNQDALKTLDKCIRVASQSLEEGKSVAVDNTNVDNQVRAKWVELAKKNNIPIRCVYLMTPTEISIHNDVVRALNDNMNPERRSMLPTIAFNSFNKKFQQPSLQEGFQDVTEIPFKFYGSNAEKAIWSRHWV